MKKRVRVYKPIQSAQSGAQVQAIQQQQQQTQMSPEMLQGIIMQQLMPSDENQGVPPTPDEIYSALIKQNLDPGMVNDAITAAVESINQLSNRPGVPPVADIEEAQIVEEDNTNQNKINSILNAPEDDSYLYETNPALLEDDDEEYKCGGPVSKHSFVSNVMKLAKKQVGGQEGGNKADNTDTARGDRSMIKPNFLAGIKDTAMEAQLKQQAEMQYDMMMNQNQAPEGMYPMAQRGGQQRRTDRFYRNISNMIPSGGLQNNISRIDVRKVGLFGRPRQYSIDFFQNQHASTVNNGIPRELPGKETAGTTTKQTAKPEAKPRKWYTEDAPVSPVNQTGTGTGGTGTGEKPKPVVPEVEEIIEEATQNSSNPYPIPSWRDGIFPEQNAPYSSYNPTSFDTEPWKGAMGDLYEQNLVPNNRASVESVERDPKGHVNRIVIRERDANGKLKLDSKGKAISKTITGKEAETAYRDFKKYNRLDVDKAFEVPTSTPGHGFTGRDWQQTGLQEKPFYQDGLPNMPIPNQNRYYKTGGFLPEYQTAPGQVGSQTSKDNSLTAAELAEARKMGINDPGFSPQGTRDRIASNKRNTWIDNQMQGNQIDPANLPVQLLDKAGNVTGMTTQGRAETQKLKHRIVPANNNKGLKPGSVVTKEQIEAQGGTWDDWGKGPDSRNNRGYSPNAQYPPLFGGERRDTRGSSLRDMVYPFNRAVEYAGSWGQQQGAPRDAQGNVYSGPMDNAQLSRLNVTKLGLLGRPKRYTTYFNVPGTTGSSQGIHTGSSPTMYRGSDGALRAAGNNQAPVNSPQGITNLADSAGMTDAQYEAQFTDNRGGRGKAADFFYNLNKGDRSGLFDKIGAKFEPHQNLQFPDAQTVTPDVTDQRSVLGPPEFIQHPNVNAQPENLSNPNNTAPGVPDFMQHPNVNAQPENLNDPYAPGAPDFMQHPNVSVQPEYMGDKSIDPLPTIPSGLDPEVLQNYFNNPNIQANVPDYALEPDSTFQDWQMRNYGGNPDVYAWNTEDMFDDSRFESATPQGRKALQAVADARNTTTKQSEDRVTSEGRKAADKIESEFGSGPWIGDYRIDPEGASGYWTPEWIQAYKKFNPNIAAQPGSPLPQLSKPGGSPMSGNLSINDQIAWAEYQAQENQLRDPGPYADQYKPDWLRQFEYEESLKGKRPFMGRANRQEGGELLEYQSLGEITTQCPQGYRKNADGICEEMFTGNKNFGYNAPSSLGQGLSNPFANQADTNPITGQATGAQHFNTSGTGYENQGLQYPGSDSNAFSVDFKNKNMYNVDFESGVNQFNMFANMGAGLLEQRSNNKNLKRLYDKTNADEQYTSQTYIDRMGYDPNSGLIDEMGFTGAQRGGQMPGQETYMSEEQIRQFLADGGEIEFI